MKFSMMRGFLVIVVVSALGCASTGTRQNDFVTETDVVDFVSMLRREIPPGSSIDDASRVMRSYGFDCQIKRDSSFSADLPDGSHSITKETLEGVDFIRCSRVRKYGIWVTMVTTVAIIIFDDVVTDIRINNTGYGP